MVVCTLCSCYPWPVLGLPPVWYKSAPYRSRAVIDPRGVLADFGVSLPDDVELQVWDSTAEIRYLVLPQRPAGTDGWTDEQLAALVTRDSMIGTGLPLARSRRMGSDREWRYDMGGMGASGGRARVRGAPVPRTVGAPRLCLTLAMGATGQWNLDQSRAARESLPPAQYLASSYYRIWVAALGRLMVERGLVAPEEIADGRMRQAPSAIPRVLAAESVAALAAGSARASGGDAGALRDR
jgi:hypothetical protein